MSSGRYFAQCAPSQVPDKIVAHYDKLSTWLNPMATKWQAAHLHYFGDLSVAGRTWAVTRRGEEGELAAVRINRARTLSKARQALITASRINWGARSANASAGSDGATTLAKQILESAWKREGLGQLDGRWVELSEVYGEGYVFATWDRTRGADAQPDSSGAKLVRQGDVRLYALPPWYVKTDPYRTRPEDNDWWYVRLERPKADLCELYTKLLDGKEADAAAEAIWNVSDPWLRQMHSDLPNIDNDLAPEIHFIHRPTIALPEGRHVIFCNGEVVLRDTPLIGKRGDYERVPLVRLAADEYVDSARGWTSFFDALGPQEVLDALDTTQATTITTFGNPSLVYEKGTDFEPSDVAKGYRPIQTQPGVNARDPHFLTPPELAQSHLEYRKELKADQRELLGLNEAALGQVGTTEKNAQADALAASMAVQQAGNAVEARRLALSELGNVYLTTLRHNVNTERVLQLVGQGESNMVADTRTWTGSDLGTLGDVEVDEVSAMEATPQGRWAMAEKLLELQIAKTPQDVVEIFETGRLDGMIDPIHSQELLWRAQNEALSRGEVPPCHPVENQVAGYQKNAAVLYSVSALNNPTVQTAVQTLLDKRYFYQFGTQPAQDGAMGPQFVMARRRFMLGLGPEPMMPQMGPSAPGAQSGTAPPQAGATSSTEPPAGLPGLPEGGPNIPAPNNPLTGAPVEPGQPPLQ